MHRERASLSIGNTKAISRLGSCSGLLVLFRMTSNKLLSKLGYLNSYSTISLPC
jgi:hypothetical protein